MPQNIYRGFGLYPAVSATNTLLTHGKNLHLPKTAITRGMGGSYGDSAIYKNILSSKSLNFFQEFNHETGSLICDSGITLAEILALIVPKGWFLPTTPGTKNISLGGAIASDVHGKNHHQAGCFSQHVLNITLQLGSGEIVTCSQSQEPELFRATCGGMGLSGIILAAEIQLLKIKSGYFLERTYKTNHWRETLEILDHEHSTPYSVAWADFLCTKKHIGRSLISLGDHAEKGELKIHKKPLFSVPIFAPNFLLNHLSIRAFNKLYYNKSKHSESARTVHYDTFFYPLDKISNWNFLYGKNGFTQYQFVLPDTPKHEAIEKIITLIMQSNHRPYLTTIKRFGSANQNYLSFPLDGFCFAFDFKIRHGLWELLNRLDIIVADYGGRIYLAKDCRIQAPMFRRMYPRWDEFLTICRRYGAGGKFASNQSNRTGITP
jgi:decaprenylphospho-beta-D-ribofuranose 2-oxidase